MGLLNCVWVLCGPKRFYPLPRSKGAIVIVIPSDPLCPDVRSPNCLCLHSGGIDWTFHHEPLKPGVPKTPAYRQYADAHMRELISRYRAPVLWGDITYPRNSEIRRIVSEYYNTCCNGVINNRFDIPLGSLGRCVVLLPGMEPWPLGLIKVQMQGIPHDDG